MYFAATVYAQKYRDKKQIIIIIMFIFLEYLYLYTCIHIKYTFCAYCSGNFFHGINYPNELMHRNLTNCLFYNCFIKVYEIIMWFTNAYKS
jgi:hypothetical protein